VADFIFNTALGRVRTFADNAAGGVAASQIVCILLTASAADDTARDFDDIAALLAGTANEANFTNYARKDIEDASVTVTVDDTNNRVSIDVPDQTWVAAGGAVNNTLTDAVFAYDPTGSSADSALIPISQHDFTPTTDGSNLTLQIDPAGLIRAS
jgi:hypothetical protein